MANPVQPANPTTLGVLRAPITDRNGIASRDLVKYLQQLETKTNVALNIIGQLNPNTTVTGASGTLGNLLQNLDANGIMTALGVDFSRSYTQKTLTNVPDGAARKAVAQVDAAQLAIIDFSQGAHQNKNLANVADGPAGGRSAWTTQTQFTSAVSGTGNLLLKNVNNVSSSTSGPTTTSTTYAQVPDLTLNITTKGNPVYVAFSVSFNNSQSAADALFAVFVDGSQSGPNIYGASPTGGQNVSVGSSWIITGLSAASHTFAIFWKSSVNTNTVTGNGTDRAMEVIELG